MFNLKIRQFSAEGDKSCICRLSSLDSVCSQKWQVQIMTWILKNRTIHLLPNAIWKRVKIHIWATIHMKALFKIFLLIYNVNSFTSWAEYQLSFNKVFGFFLGHGYRHSISGLPSIGTAARFPRPVLNFSTNAQLQY